MKKLLSILALAFAATNINAQLVVDSLGRVGIGTDTPRSLLSVGASGSNTSTVLYCKSNDKQRGIYVANSADTGNNTKSYGGQFRTENATGNNIGIYSLSLGNNQMGTSQWVVGLSGCAGQASNAVGVYGGKDLQTGSLLNFAGVYGAELGTSPTFTNYPGTYAGYFRGKVCVTNGIYATLLSPSASPSPSGQNGATILSGRGESVTDKLNQVQALQFLRYDPTQETNTSRASLEDIVTDNMSPEGLDSLMETVEDEEPVRYLSPVQYGLDADQLKSVYPELVYEDANGNVSINYVEMVPLLVQCINELSAKVAELEGTSPKKAKAQPTAIEESVSDIDMVRMDQNKPNPFSESTVISLNIPQETQTANIYIYDMNGKQVQSLPVSERGETNITVYASDLAAGMYIYTLVVDGKVAVTRRIIVTK